jgi:flagellar biosynthetic protein FliR
VLVSAFTPNLVLTAFVVFCRIGGCLLVIPGFSSPRVPVRARLFVAIAVSLALTPMLLAEVKPMVDSVAPVGLLTIIVSESLKGILIGLLGRFFFIALETMAMSISLSIGLTSSFGSPVDEESMPTIVSLVSLAAILLIFVTDLHLELFRGLAASYLVLPVKQGFDPRTGLTQLVDEATRTFLFTLRIAAPFLVFSIIANFAIGLINKLVPQIPVTFIATPFLLAGGLLIFYLTARPALDLFISAFGSWLKAG